MDARIGNVVRLLQAGPFDERTLRRVRAGLAALRGHSALAEELGNLVVLLDDFAERASEPSVACGGYLLAGELCEASGMQDQFVERLSLAMDADPTDKNTPRRLRQVLSGASQRPRLLALLATRARALEAQDEEGSLAAEAFAQLGSEHEKDGDIEHAIEAYDHALELEPTVGTVEALASLYARRRKAGDAEQAADLYCMLADVVPETSARGFLKRALTLVPGHADATRRLAELIADSEDQEEETIVRPTAELAQPTLAPPALAVPPPLVYSDGVNNIASPERPPLTAPPPAALRTVRGLAPVTPPPPAATLPPPPMAARPVAGTMLPPASAQRSPSEQTTQRRPQTQVPPNDSALNLQPALPRAGIPAQPVAPPMAASPMVTNMATGDGTSPPADATLQPTHVMATPRPTGSSLTPAADLPTLGGGGPAPKPWRDWAVGSLAGAAAVTAVFVVLSPLRVQVETTSASASTSAAVEEAEVAPETAPEPTTLAAAPAEDEAAAGEPEQAAAEAADEGADEAEEADAEEPAALAAVAGQAVPDEAPSRPKRGAHPTVEVVAKRVRVSGAKLRKRKLLSALRDADDKLEQCYEQALRRKPRMVGHLVYNLDVKRNGDAKSAKHVAGSIRDKRLHACVGKALKATTYPKFKEGNVAKVRLPLRFVNEH